MTQKAVFFDRDGVLNIDNDFVTDIYQVVFYENTPDIIAYCRNLGYKIFVVTNQTVVARGMMPEEELVQLNNKYKEYLINQNKDAVIDKIYYCPHHPNASIEKYRINCNCRKPYPGMILAASEEFNIDLSKSFMIGDRISDITAGYLAGCKTIHCLSGKHTEKPIESTLNVILSETKDLANSGNSKSDRFFALLRSAQNDKLNLDCFASLAMTENIKPDFTITDISELKEIIK